MVEQVGAALRAARARHKLSLRQLAADIGVSASLLSQVETGKTQPSVSTLYALVNRLGMSVDDIFGAHRAAAVGATPARRPATLRADPVPAAPAKASGTWHGVVQGATDHPVLEMENGVTWELLTVGDRAVVDLILVTYRPGATSSISNQMTRHQGVEYAYMLQGELEMRLDFDTRVLRAGDSLCFDSTRPHMFVNHGDSDARGIWFIVGREGLDASKQAAALLAAGGFAGATGARQTR
jgi:transcriptional regulator with XRE-family HTH domain/quercetin dioxygenase-like cupin family protein